MSDGVFGNNILTANGFGYLTLFIRQSYFCLLIKNGQLLLRYLHPLRQKSVYQLSLIPRFTPPAKKLFQAWLVFL